jgi:hypothetical protein
MVRVICLTMTLMSELLCEYDGYSEELEFFCLYNEFVDMIRKIC